jgi:hypothetical protein
VQIESELIEEKVGGWGRDDEEEDDEEFVIDWRDCCFFCQPN